MSAFALLWERLGVSIVPLSATAAYAAYQGVTCLLRRDPEQRELDLMREAGNIAMLAGMFGTIDGLTRGLAGMRPGDPGSILELISALRIALWTTYAGIVTALGCQFFILLVYKPAPTKAAS